METTDISLWRLTGEALALCYRGAQGYEARLTCDASLVLSGEAVADLNYAIIDASSNAENRLNEFVQAAKSRKIPMLVFLTPQAAQTLKPAAEKLGLKFAEHFPWMTYHPTEPHPLEERSFQITRIQQKQDLDAATKVIACVMNVAFDVVNRAFAPMILEGPGLDVFVAKQDGEVVSTVQTTRSGSVVGIWAMATAPTQQRRGAAKALLNHVIAYHCRRGADCFYLGATAAGKPLYDKVGFRTVSVAEVWVLPEEAKT